jgi:hypothetical protein
MRMKNLEIEITSISIEKEEKNNKIQIQIQIMIEKGVNINRKDNIKKYNIKIIKNNKKKIKKYRL